MTGRTLGDFSIHERIGEGGYGVVYRAEQRALGREAVVKVLHARHGETELVQRFLREAQLASRLDHPYAAHIYAFGAEPEGVLWIAMELVRGTTLRKVLEAQPGGRLPLARLVPLLDGLCEVVHTAHEQGIVHRDLKPDNVMVLSRAGRLLPKLLDLGIAKLVAPDTGQAPPDTGQAPADTGQAPADIGQEPPDTAFAATLRAAHTGAASAELTSEGAMLGSPHYMAPEQWIDGGGAIDARTDIYALGVLAYEALCGKRPYPNGSLLEIARNHTRGTPGPLPTDVPAALAPVLTRALAKRAADRYPTALAFGEALRGAAGLRLSAEALPRLDEALRTDIAWLPQPIADAVAALEGARNPHQARDALWAIVRVTVRWLGIVALAARSRVGRGGSDPAEVSHALRELHRRDLADDEWLELVRALARPFAAIRDAYPVPELVDLALQEPSPFTPLFALRASEGVSTTEESLRDRLARTLPVLAPMLRAVAFLTSYQLVVPRGDRADVWMGTRRGVRPVIAYSAPTPPAPPARPRGDATDVATDAANNAAKDVAKDVAKRAAKDAANDAANGRADQHVRAGAPSPDNGPVLADLDGRPILQLAPLVQIAAPSPGAADEVFVFAGAGRGRGHGARLVAEPHGFERHDDAVWEWMRDTLVAIDDPTASSAIADAPYRGLAAFTERDADRFFGRERAVEAFVNQLLVQPLLAVVGPSGAGKSSFVRAGVIPALPASWRAVVLRPGPHPEAALAASFDRDGLVRGETLVIVVDQAEELFTSCLDADERARFAATLVELASDERVRVTLTIRDDFLARAGELPALRDRLARAVTLLPTPSVDDLLRIVREPARRAGYDFDESDLPDRMVRAVAGEPGALALLSFTASRLWDLRDRHFQRITRASYDAIGGVAGALAQHAEATLAQLGTEEQRLVREAFRHLATAEGTRAVLARKELDDVLGTSAQAAAVVDRLVDARLLVVAEGDAGDERVEVVHEALLTAWPRLVQWRREDADGARLRDQLRAAARPWHERGRPRGLLWRGEALDDYRRWRARWTGTLPEVDQAFGDASIRDARRGRRIRTALAAAIATVLVAAVIGLALLNTSSQQHAEDALQASEKAVQSSREARDALVQSRIDQGRRYLVDDGDYVRALPYLADAYAKGDRSYGLRFMLGRAMQLADTPTVGFASSAAAAAFRADGRVLAAGYYGHAVLIDAQSGATIARYPLRVAQRTRTPPVVRRDGTLAALALDDATILWDGEHATSIAGSGVERLAFDDTGERLAIATREELAIYDVRTRVRQWATPIDGDPRLVWSGDDVIALIGKTVTRHARAGHTALHRANDVVGGPRNIVVLVHSCGEQACGLDPGHVEVLDPARVQPRLFDIPNATAAAVDPAGKRIAIGTQGGALVVTNLDGTIAGYFRGHAARVRTLAFTHDGRRLLSAADDQTVRVWNVASQLELALYRGPIGNPTAIASNGDDKRMVVVSADGVRTYPIDDPALALSFDVGEPVGATRYTTDGRLLVTADSAVELRDAATGHRIARVGDRTLADGAHASPDGTLVAIPMNGTEVELRELPGGRLRSKLRSDSMVEWAIFAPNGQSLATGNNDGAIELWTLDGTRTATMRGHSGAVLRIAISPDGKKLVSGSNDRTVRLWDLATQRGVLLGRHEDDVLDARFDMRGDTVLSASTDRRVQLWSTLAPAPPRSYDQIAPATSAALDPTAQMLAVGTDAGFVELWEVATRREIGRFRHASAVTSLDIHDDRLMTAGLDGRIVIWKTELSDTSRDIATFLECHIPFELRDGALQHRDTHCDSKPAPRNP